MRKNIRSSYNKQMKLNWINNNITILYAAPLGNVIVTDQSSDWTSLEIAAVALLVGVLSKVIDTAYIICL